MEEKKKNEKTKKKKNKEKEEKRGEFFEILVKGGLMKKIKITHLNVWFGLG